MDHRLLQILENTACLSKSQLQAYLDKSLQPEELYAVEMHLIECPICNDAIEGLKGVEQLHQLLNTIPVMTKLPVPRNKDKKPVEPKTETNVPSHATTEIKQKPESTVTADSGERNRTTASASKSKASGSSWGRQWGKPLGIAATILLLFSLLWYFELGGADEVLGNGDAAVLVPQTDSLLADAATAMPPKPLSSPAVATPNTTAVPIPDTVKPLAPADLKEPIIKAEEEIQKKVVPKEEPIVKKEVPASVPATVAAKLPEQKERQTQDALQPDATPFVELAEENPTARLDRKASEQVPAVKTISANTTDKTLPHSDFEKGMELYRQQQYGSAILYFRTAANKSTEAKYYDALYYSAMAYKNMGKKRKAVTYLKKIVADEAAPNKSEAQRQLDALQ